MQRIGRFEVISRLGEGGMGVVYAARDPDLDRPVAIKLLNRPGMHGSLRLVREAQALARLQHPNVVGVHEVGQHEGQVYVAMEHVAGVSFDCLEPAPATWRGALELLMQAGRGLAAAHAQGLVHRDIKPHNILVGRDGRVRVADFGLARLADADAGEPLDAWDGSVDTLESADTVDGAAPSHAAAPRTPGALGAPLTDGPAFMGTPRYMAPEQHAMRPAVAASDQFAFCVTLWEAIFGAHPFVRAPDESWSDAIVAGRRSPPPRGKAPRWLSAALERGLEADPRRRHPSMSALVAVVERGVGRRRRAALALVAVVLVAGAATAGVLSTGSSHRSDPCASAGDGLRAVWTADARAGIARAFAAARPYGADSAQRVAARVDAYGARWSSARVAACRATHDRREQSAELLDRRMGCFDRALAELDVVLRVLGEADPGTVDRALDLVGRLPDPDGCGPQLGSVMPDPDDPRAAAIRRDHLALTEAWHRGDLVRARMLAADLKERADELGHPAIRAFELIAYVRATENVADAATIDAALTQALNDAIRAGDRSTEAAAVVWMLRQANRRQDVDALATLLPLAAATAARDGVSRNVRIMEAFNTADALRNLGRFDQSIAACDRLATLEDPPQADAKDCRCNTLAQAVRPEASEACAAAVAANEAKYGARHIYTAGSLATAASVESQRGRHAEALATRLKILPVYASVLAPDSREMLSLRMGLAGSYITLERLADARAIIEPALEARRASKTPPDRETALLHGLLAEILVGSGEIDEGLRAIDEAERIHAQAMGETHAMHVEVLAYRGDLYYKAGRWATAETSFARCAVLAATAFGKESLLHGGCLAGRADALVELGRAREARAPAEDAIAVLTTLDGAGLHLATAHLALGRALAAAGQRARGIAELERAAQIFRAEDSDGAALRRTEAALRTLR